VLITPKASQTAAIPLIVRFLIIDFVFPFSPGARDSVLRAVSARDAVFQIGIPF
jgi:hypothetical protein